MISLPKALQGKASYTVYREHNGKAESLKNGGSGERYEVSDDKTAITIFAQKYSTYAIGYTDSYTVIFDAGEGTVSPANADTNSEGKLSSLPTPTRTGYTFLGWYTASGENVTENTVFTTSTTVTARWREIINDTDDTNDTDPSDDNSTESNSGSSSGSSSRRYREMPNNSNPVGTTTKPTNSATENTTTDTGTGSENSVNTGTESENILKTFGDLPSGAWYQEAVGYVVSKGLMSGYGNGKFGPNENLSRAQLAQILYNNEGQPTPTGTSSFADVASGSWYANAVIWANQKGIVGGYGKDLFGPDDPITREQLAVMLWRYAKNPSATNEELHFSDADEAGSFALEALKWAVEKGIITGYGDGRIDPKGLANRAQVAQMLMRYLKGMEG